MESMPPAGGRKTTLRIYFPATINVLTRGHILSLKYLRDYKHQKHPQIIIGLLTKEALRGYKKEITPFKDRLAIMEVVANGIRDRFDCRCIQVVPQNSLDPSKNIKKYRPVAIASGDGFEPAELKAIKKWNLQKINIKLPKNYSSSAIIKKCQSVV
jgi:hypothetical protein